MKKIDVLYVVVLGLLAGVVGGAGAFFVFENSVTGDAEVHNVVEKSVYVEESQNIEAIAKAAPAVVSITTYKDLGVSEDPAAGYFTSHLRQLEVSSGTGFIVDDSGLVLTNKHVLDSGSESEYFVEMENGTRYSFEVVSLDPFDDVAVGRIVAEEGTEFAVVELGDSGSLKVGQKVLAIGNALGIYENTVTSGIVSATGRRVSAYDEVKGQVNFAGLIQTDAAIHLGNSGGPLIDLNGRVIGMNVAVAEAGSGVGFAIPADDLKPVVDSIKEYGEIIRPVLGVSFLMLSGAQAEEIDSTLDHGALVVGGNSLFDSAVVAGGAADEAGILEGDVIVSVDGVDATEDNPLQKIIRLYAPGEDLILRVFRDGEYLDLEVRLRNSKDVGS